MNQALCAAALLRLSGADAIGFAHSQFTRDVCALEPGQMGWSAWLDAQGRTKAVFALLRIDTDALLLWQPLGDAEALAAGLQRFVMRSKAGIELLHGWQVLAGRQDAVPPAGTWVARDGGYALPMPDASAERAVLLAPSSLPIDGQAFQRWQRENILARLPWIDAASAALFVPQALELERLGALAFDKGCYPGQEIVARLHFRGGNKRSLACVETGGQHLDGGAQLPAATGQSSGHILYGVGPQAERPGLALAVVSTGGESARRPIPGSPSAA